MAVRKAVLDDETEPTLKHIRQVTSWSFSMAMKNVLDRNPTCSTESLTEEATPKIGYGTSVRRSLRLAQVSPIPPVPTRPAPLNAVLMSGERRQA